MNVEEGKVSPLRWLMISLAFFATLINYLDRQTLSVSAPVLREQFHMSNVSTRAWSSPSCWHIRS